MRALRRFGTFWWDFVVGDDWRVAAGVIVALGVTAAVAATGAPAWWILPVVIALLLYVSLRREAQQTAPARAAAAKSKSP
jgi:hypothetical protein